MISVSAPSRGVFTEYTYTPTGYYDTFDGSGDISSSLWNTLNSGEVSVSQTSGQYVASIPTGGAAGNNTTWFDADEGRLDYVTMSGDFEFIGRNIGIGSGSVSGQFQFSGIVVRLSAGEWEFAVAGNRGGDASSTIEYKITTSNVSTQSDLGSSVISGDRCDFRAVRSGSSVDFYYQAAGLGTDSWILIPHDGLFETRIPFGTGPVQVGLITYGFSSVTAFTGECEQVEIPIGTPVV